MTSRPQSENLTTHLFLGGVEARLTEQTLYGKEVVEISENKQTIPSKHCAKRRYKARGKCRLNAKRK